MRRREFITFLGGSVAAGPLSALAQPSSMPVIGFLGASSPETNVDRLGAFKQGLNVNGYVEGQNVAIEYRWANGQYDRLPALAAELVRRQVSVIAVAGGIPGTRAAKAATAAVPIVFLTGADPVAAGLVGSLNRPEGNLTGVTTLGDEVGSKRLELLHELAPSATVVAVLVNPINPDSETALRYLQAAARTLGLQLRMHTSSV